jgi:hypothetical protein
LPHYRFQRYESEEEILSLIRLFLQKIASSV